VNLSYWDARSGNFPLQTVSFDDLVRGRLKIADDKIMMTVPEPGRLDQYRYAADHARGFGILPAMADNK
jgi:hypothetical protein